MWECITMIEAQEQLKELTSKDWPNMKKATREKFHKELYSKAYPKEMRTKKYITVQDLQKVLGR